MKRIKKWLFERFYPAAAKVEIEELRNTIAAKDAEIANLTAYLDGLEAGMRAQRRIVINNEVTK